MQSFQLRNVVKYRIYIPVKFASLIYMFVLPTEKVTLRVIQIYKKFGNFAWLYFLYLTTIRRQTL